MLAPQPRATVEAAMGLAEGVREWADGLGGGGDGKVKEEGGAKQGRWRRWTR